MSSRKQGLTQGQACAKAGISERSGRRIEEGRISVLERKERHWRTRQDPFAEVWDEEIVPLLEKQPALDATTLFEDLQDRHPGQFGNGKKRTFQRRVKAWKALHTPLLRDPVPRRSQSRRREHSSGGSGFNSYRRIQCFYGISQGEPLTRIRVALRALQRLEVALSSFRNKHP